MSFLPVMEYFIGIAVFGFVYYIIDGGLIDPIEVLGIHVAGQTWGFLHLLWSGILIVYLVFGGMWLIRRYDEQSYYPGGGFR